MKQKLKLKAHKWPAYRSSIFPLAFTIVAMQPRLQRHKNDKKKKKQKRQIETELKTFLDATVAATGNSLIQRWSPFAANFNLHCFRFLCYSFSPPQLFSGQDGGQDLNLHIHLQLHLSACQISFSFERLLCHFFRATWGAFNVLCLIEFCFRVRARVFVQTFVLFAFAGHFYEISAFVAYVLSIAVIKLAATSTGFVLPAVAK